MKILRLCIASLITLFIVSGFSHAASCSAENQLNPPDTCSFDCATGQSAQCANASGAGAPTCQCSGEASIQTRRLLTPTRAAAPTALIPVTENRQLSETDVVSVINSKLQTLPPSHISNRSRRIEDGQECTPRTSRCEELSAPIPVGRNVSRPQRLCTEYICGPRYKEVIDPVMGALTSNGTFTVERAPIVTVSEPNWSSVPTQYFGLKTTYRNCSPERQTLTFSHKTSLVVGNRLTKTKTIKNGTSTKATIGFSYVVTGSASLDFTSDITLGSSEEANFQKTEDFTYGETVNIAPMSLVVYTHEFIRRVVDIKYTGNVQLDGGLSSNFANVNLISKALPNPDDRIFEFSGYVTSSNVYEGIINNTSKRLVSADCQQESSTVVREPYMREVAISTPALR